MQNKIDIGTTIDLPDLLQSRLLIQGNSGAGKSVLARVIIEQTFGIVPFIVMDIEGEYYTLKEKFGDILVIGGQHADIPIRMESAKLLPKEIISNHLSVIVDMSDLLMNDRILYSKYFLETMMDLPKEYWINYLVFLEEAHKLCGEQDKQVSATAVKDLMSRGRKRGYCGILLTQRISKLHKDAAAECNNKFIGKTFLDLDMDRSAKELGFTSASEFNRLSLRELKRGDFFAFGTSIEPHQVHIVTINHPQTKIPKAGVNLDIKPKAPTEKIKAMLAKLNEIEIEKPKSGTKLQKSDTNVQETEIIYLQSEINIAKQKLLESNKQLEAKDKQIQHFTSIIEQASKILGAPVPKFDLSITYTPAAPYIKNKMTEHNQKFTDKVYEKANSQKQLNKVPNSTNGVLPVGEGKILTAIAQHKSCTRQQLTVLTSYTRSSRNTYLQRLKQKGYINENGDRFAATESGIKALGNFVPLPTGDALREYWYQRLPPGESAILQFIVSKYPATITREQISENTSYTRSSRNTYLQRLSAKELVVVERDLVKAADELFN